MTAPTAMAIIRDLDRRQSMRQMEMVADLDAREHDAVRQALSVVRGSARVDVSALLASVRRDLVAREAQRPPSKPWKYALTLMGEHQREQFRVLTESGVDCDAAATKAMSSGERWGIAGLGASSKIAQIEPDDLDDDDDGDDPPRKPRSVPRLPSRRERVGTPSPSDPVNPASLPKEPVLTRPEVPRRAFLGGRLLGTGAPGRPFGASIDFDPHYSHFRPPWLIDDGDDDEPDEGDDDGPADEARQGAN